MTAVEVYLPKVGRIMPEKTMHNDHHRLSHQDNQLAGQRQISLTKMTQGEANRPINAVGKHLLPENSSDMLSDPDQQQ